MYRKITRIITVSGLALLLFPAGGCHSVRAEDTKSPADYVNPFIGASCNPDAAGAYHGLGKTIPGAITPFGMVQVSPNTVTGKDKSSGTAMKTEPSKVSR